MTDDLTPAASVEDKLLAKTSRHIQTLIRSGKDELGTDDIALAIQQDRLDFAAGALHNVGDMLATHAKVLNCAFTWFLDRVEDHPKSAETSLALALKSQHQVLRTLMAWKAIRDDTRMQDSIERFRLRERDLLAELRREQQKNGNHYAFSDPFLKNEDERTEQDDT